MSSATTGNGTRWETRAAALCSACAPGRSMLAHDPIAASATMPGAFEANGLEARWGAGATVRAVGGPLRRGRLWIAGHCLQAGEHFATAEIHGVRFGPLYVRNLMVAWTFGLSAVQIEASVGVRALLPGTRARVAGLEIQVGRGLPSAQASCSLTGLAIATPDEPVLRLAVVHAEAQPDRPVTAGEGGR